MNDGREIDAHEIVEALREAGVDAYTEMVGGGLYVAGFVLDPTGRDTGRVIWITHEVNDEGEFLIGFYNQGDADETYEGPLVTLVPYSADHWGTQLEQLVAWVTGFARATGLVLP